MSVPARTYLTTPQALRALLQRMVERPWYRPRGYSEGDEGIRNAQSHLKDARAMLEDVRSEGDS